MKETNALELLRSFKGKEFTASPSPFMLWLKPVVIEAESGSLSFKYSVRKEWTNPMGILHGGITAAIMDDVIGATMFSLNEQHFYTTLNNVVDYFATARENDTIIADTRIIKKGNQVVNAQCEIWNADKTRLIARGYSNLLKTNLKK
ncbi:MAG: PaaI family thioesterase [Bacteroidota bacterium]